MKLILVADIFESCTYENNLRITWFDKLKELKEFIIICEIYGIARKTVILNDKATCTIKLSTLQRIVPCKRRVVLELTTASSWQILTRLHKDSSLTAFVTIPSYRIRLLLHTWHEHKSLDVCEANCRCDFANTLLHSRSSHYKHLKAADVWNAGSSYFHLIE